MGCHGYKSSGRGVHSSLMINCYLIPTRSTLASVRGDKQPKLGGSVATCTRSLISLVIADRGCLRIVGYSCCSELPVWEKSLPRSGVAGSSHAFLVPMPSPRSGLKGSIARPLLEATPVVLDAQVGHRAQMTGRMTLVACFASGSFLFGADSFFS